MRRVIFTSAQCPGDLVMLTACVRDLHAAFPGEFLTDIRSSSPELWEHNPYITPLSETDQNIEVVPMHYPLIHQSNQQPTHFVASYHHYLNQIWGIDLPVSEFKGDIHLSEEEKSAPPLLSGLSEIEKPYWIFVAGGKYDFTAKWWNPLSFQKVVNHFRNRFSLLQCGLKEHWHPTLEGVTNLVGKTNLREFIHLMHHAEGVICPVTLAMHLAASVPLPEGQRKVRPCVVIAGGREPLHWEAWPGHQFLSTVGLLDCCATGGCWKSRCQLMNDGDEKDRHNICEQPVQLTEDLRIPKCLEMISPEDVIRAVERYL